MQHRVFMAEDDPDDVYLLKMAFDETSFDIDLVNFPDGKALVQALAVCDRTAMPHLVLLDLNLPIMDGKTALKSMKEHAATRSIPVVVFTTSKSENDIRDVYELGANSYMVKSPDFVELVRKIQSLCDYWFGTVKLKGIG